MTDWVVNYKEWAQLATANDKAFITYISQLDLAWGTLDTVHNGLNLPDVSLHYVPFTCIVWIVCLHYPESNQPFANQTLLVPYITICTLNGELLPREQSESEAFKVGVLRNCVVNAEFNFSDLIDDSVDSEFH